MGNLQTGAEREQPPDVLRCLEVLYDFGIRSLHVIAYTIHQYTTSISSTYTDVYSIFFGLWQVFRNELEAERQCRSPLLGFSLVQKAKVKRPHCSILLQSSSIEWKLYVYVD